MDSEAARQSLVDAVGASYAPIGNFVVRGETLADSRVSRFDLAAEMADEVRDDVMKAVRALTQKQFLTYDPSYQTNASQVLVENVVEIPELRAVDESLRLADVPDDSGGRGVVAMAHILGTGDRAVVAYRLKGAGIAMRRSRAIPLLPRDGIYQPIGGEVLYYEPRFDVFTCGGRAYFLNVTVIQTKLHAIEKALSMAREALEAVTANVKISGLDKLREAVLSDPSMRAKMGSIARLLETDPDYAKNLTTANLVSFVQRHPAYGIQVTLLDGETVLVFDPSPQRRHQIPRLLADDYLRSDLTNRDYEAGSKQRLQV